MNPKALEVVGHGPGTKPFIFYVTSTKVHFPSSYGTQRFHDNIEERDRFVAGQYLRVAIPTLSCQYLLAYSLF